MPEPLLGGPQASCYASFEIATGGTLMPGKMTHTGTATVVSAKVGKGMSYRKGKGVYGGLTGELHEPFDCVLDVTPDGAPPFRAETTHKFSARAGAHPRVGDQVKVRCNPKKQTVEFDLSDDAQFSKESLAEQMSPAAKAALEQAGGEPAEQLMQDATADPASFREKMRAGRAGPVVIIGGKQVSGFPVGATPTDPADQIAKLAELRDRGALSDAEFQAQKKKILGT